MRKLIVQQFITLDGVMEAPEKWNSQYLFDEEITSDLLHSFSTSDALLLGRTTYEFLAARWPVRKGVMADWFNNVHKYVVSSTLKKSLWNNSTIIDTNTIKKLKTQAGKNILVLGSYQLCRTLIKGQLADEYRLYVYPLLLGNGKKLFEEDTHQQTLELLELRVFSCGAIGAAYKGLTNTCL